MTWNLVGVTAITTTTSSPKSNGAIHGSVQTITVDGQKREYVCFTYTTVNRGGLWCQDLKVGQ